MALTSVTLCCYGTCAAEDQITSDVGTKTLKSWFFRGFWKKEKSVIWLSTAHFVEEHMYDVHTDAGGYVGKDNT